MAKTEKSRNRGNLGFKAEMFKAAGKLRGNMEPSDYKHVALGLILFSTWIEEGTRARTSSLRAT